MDLKAGRYRDEWRSIDLAILEMVMPRMSGEDLSLAMKGINPQLHALLASGCSVNHDTQDALAAGVPGFVHKSFEQTAPSIQIAEAMGRPAP